MRNINTQPAQLVICIRWTFPATTQPLCPHPSTVKHRQMRTTRSKLLFTYRTFGASGAQPQSHYSQHAGYSQHLLGDSGPRRPLSSSPPFFLCLFPSLPLLLPCRTLPFIQRLRFLSSLLKQCANSSLICGTTRAAWSVQEGHRVPATRYPAATAPRATHRSCV